MRPARPVLARALLLALVAYALTYLIVRGLP